MKEIEKKWDIKWVHDNNINSWIIFLPINSPKKAWTPHRQNGTVNESDKLIILDLNAT